MRILYLAQMHDYGQPARGHSFEHWNFFDTLGRMGHEVLYFDLGKLLDRAQRGRLNQRLFEVVRSERPALMFTVLYQDELDQAIVHRITNETETTTFNWFADDHWRFDNFSRRWAPCFDFVATTASSALPKYEKIGYRNAIKTQWGCNPYLYRKLDVPLRHDISFVGRPHGNRPAIIQLLREAGLNIETFGLGWENGRVSQEQMIEIFNASRINLNLSNASSGGTTWRKRAISAALRVPGALLLWQSIRGIVRPEPAAQELATARLHPEQIKGRNFEVPGCGGFMLTGPADNLGAYFDLDREIVCFNDIEDLIRKARQYLADDAARQAIADAGYARTMREHTYVHRFTELFERMGLPHEPAEEVLRRTAGAPAPEIHEVS